MLDRGTLFGSDRLEFNRHIYELGVTNDRSANLNNCTINKYKQLLLARDCYWKLNKKMKKYFLMLIAILVLGNIQAQNPPESVLNKYHKGSSNEKYTILYSYLNSFIKNDSLLIIKSLELNAYFKKQNDYTGADYTNLFLADRAFTILDYATSLSIALPTLSSFKSRNDTTGILLASFKISRSYSSSRNYVEAIKYLKEICPIYIARGDKRELSGIYNEIGATCGQAFLPDLGLIYAQKAVNLANELKDDNLSAAPLGTVAENYIAKGEYDLALLFLKKSKQVFISLSKKDSLMMHTWYNNDLAQAYLGMKKYDSVIHYSHRSLALSKEANDINQQLRTYEYLYKSFDAMGMQDSSNKYYRLAGILKDSLLSSEKIKAIEAITFSASLRQQELDAEKLKAEEERKQNIQYSLLAIGIVTFLILFFLLSRSIIVNEKWISFFGILGLLIVFEFINLLIHPFLERVTHHSPVLMLVALVALASFLIPLHHRIEKWIKEKMTEKNKKIRLDNAKKTIEALEVENNSV